MFVGSVSGATGGQIGTKLLQKLEQVYKNTSQIAFTVYSSSNANDETVANYHTLMATGRLLENNQMLSVFVLDNNAISKISNLTGLSDSEHDMNILTAQLVSGVTKALRFDSMFDQGMRNYTSQFVPY